MDTEKFNLFCHMVRQRSGISLTPDKVYLAQSRLKDVMKETGHDDLISFFEYLASASSEKTLAKVVDAMTTNESFFFRDETPFEGFEKKIVPELIKDRPTSRKIRIWCAACSSGQEPYSLSMMIDEKKAVWGDWNFEIVATDISENMIERAKIGEFSRFEINRGLTEARREKYFSSLGGKWFIEPDLKKRITFKAFNLLDDPKELGQFDVIFCRNVLIYFEPKTKTEILERISNILAPGGYLTLGAAETVVGLTKKFLPNPDVKGYYKVAGQENAGSEGFETQAMKTAV